MRCVHNMMECPLTEEPGVTLQCSPLCIHHPEFFDHFHIKEITIENVHSLEETAN